MNKQIIYRNLAVAIQVLALCHCFPDLFLNLKCKFWWKASKEYPDKNPQANNILKLHVRCGNRTLATAVGRELTRSLRHPFPLSRKALHVVVLYSSLY